MSFDQPEQEGDSLINTLNNSINKINIELNKGIFKATYDGQGGINLTLNTKQQPSEQQQEVLNGGSSRRLTRKNNRRRRRAKKSRKH